MWHKRKQKWCDDLQRTVATFKMNYDKIWTCFIKTITENVSLLYEYPAYPAANQHVHQSYRTRLRIGWCVLARIFLPKLTNVYITTQNTIFRNCLAPGCADKVYKKPWMYKWWIQDLLIHVTKSDVTAYRNHLHPSQSRIHLEGLN